jgi:hypothetical protein
MGGELVDNPMGGLVEAVWFQCLRRLMASRMATRATLL